MLDNIEKEKSLLIGNRLAPEYQELFSNGYFSWKSDAPANEGEWARNPFIYNYLNIKPNDNSYRFEFINNINKPFFNVEVNTDRSRYGKYRFYVVDFFKELGNTCEEIEDKEEVRKLIRKAIHK